MTLLDAAGIIGNVLTQIDKTLQTPGLSDADGHSLYDSRERLDGAQRDLIQRSISEADAAYRALTAKLATASAEVESVAGDLSKVGNMIDAVAQVASYADQILKLAGG